VKTSKTNKAAAKKEIAEAKKKATAAATAKVAAVT